MTSLSQASVAVQAAVDAVNGDAASTRAAIEALIDKQSQANLAIASSLRSLRTVVVTLAESLTLNGSGIDGSIVSEAESITVPDFDASQPSGGAN